jgi:hypothetical protein
MEPEVGSAATPARVVRALAFMTASVLAIGFATIVYAHPQVSPVSATQPASKQSDVVLAPAPRVIYISAVESDPNFLTKPPEGRIEWRVRPTAPTPTPASAGDYERM